MKVFSLITAVVLSCSLLAATCGGRKSTSDTQAETQAEKSRKAAEKAFQELDQE